MPGNFFDQFDTPRRDPFVVPPDPMRVAQQQAEEERKRRDQQLQEEANARANRSEARADRTENKPPAGYQWGSNGSLVPIPGGPAAKEDENATVEERKAAAFLIRALGSNDQYEAQRIGPRSLIGQQIADTAPNVLNSLPSAIGNSPQRQVADTSQDEFIAASLRQDSGAAIPEEEMERQRRIYFPMPGDGPDVLEAKRMARLRAIEGLKQSSGRMGDDAIKRWREMGSIDPETGDLTATVSDETPWPSAVGNRSQTGGLGGGGGPVNGNSPGYAQIAAGAGDLLEGGLNSTVGLLANPLGQMLYNATGYGNQRYDIGQSARDLFGLPEGNSTIAAINQAAAGGLGLGAGARALSGLASGAGQKALTEFGSRPILDFVGGAGAGAGSEAAKGMGFGPLGQTVGALLGGGAAGLPGALRGPQKRPADLDLNLIAAGQRQGIPIRRPDAVPSMRGDMAAAEASPYGGPTIARALDQDRTAVETRLGQIGGPGTPMRENFTLGQRAQGIGSRYIDRTRQQKNDKYTQAEHLAQGRRITPVNAIDEVDRNIAELQASGGNNNAAAISYLQGLRDDLSKPEGFSIAEFQRLRSAARKKIKGDQGLTVSDADRRLGSVEAAFTSDAEDQLPQAATAALREADKFYAERQGFISNVLSGLMGSRGKELPPERAAERLVAMTRNRADYQRFSRFYAEASPEEKADFAATIADTLGSGRNGEFSLAALATNIDKMPKNIRQTIFGKDGSQALEDLRLIARAKGDTTKGLNNSRTAPAILRQVGRRAAGATLAGGAAGSMAGGVSGGIMGGVIAPAAMELITAISQTRQTRLLLNPDFTKWLRQTPNNPQAMQGHVKRLQALAAKSPVVANDLEAVGISFGEALSKSPVSSAAREEEQDRRRKPPAY